MDRYVILKGEKCLSVSNENWYYVKKNGSFVKDISGVIISLIITLMVSTPFIFTEDMPIEYRICCLITFIIINSCMVYLYKDKNSMKKCFMGINKAKKFIITSQNITKHGADVEHVETIDFNKNRGIS